MPSGRTPSSCSPSTSPRCRRSRCRSIGQPMACPWACRRSVATATRRLCWRSPQCWKPRPSGPTGILRYRRGPAGLPSRADAADAAAPGGHTEKAEIDSASAGRALAAVVDRAREWPVLEERVDHVLRQPRYRIVEVSARQSAAPGDRAGSEYGAVVRRGEVDDVRADKRVLGAAEAWRHEEYLLLHQRIIVGERLGRGQNACVGRRSESEVVAVDLDAGGTAQAEAFAAENLALDALEHPRDAAMVAVRHAAIWHRLVHALGGESDPDELLRRPAAVAPQAAALAGAREVLLARPRLPSPRTGFELADLHHPRFFVAKADAPVVGVGSKIEQAAAGR